MTRPAYGFAPLVPLNEASVVIVPLPLASSNTAPTSPAPPTDSVPYRLPLPSMISEPYGMEHKASVVIVPLPLASSKIVPAFEVAVQIAAAIHDQAGHRLCPIGAVKRSQRGDRAGAVGKLENCAVVRGASLVSRTKQIAIAVQDERGLRLLPRWFR